MAHVDPGVNIPEWGVSLLRNRGSVWSGISRFIHFSYQHIYTSLKIDNKLLFNGIRKNDEFVSDIEKEASTYYMIQSTKGINIFINDLIENMK
jgi:hypothetical protein